MRQDASEVRQLTRSQRQLVGRLSDSKGGHRLRGAVTGGWQASGILSARSGSYGTMPLDAIRGVARWNIDSGLSRSFGLGESRVIQLRLEVFNLLNTVTPNNPQTTMSSSDFGKVTSLAGGTAPRVVQLGVKYQF